MAPSDVANIPSIALSIPDFEGEAILRIFANSTETEIGCYSAVVTNGASFSQPESVGTVLGIFTLITLVASFATAIYGEAVPTMRLHYAHSLSVGVVIAVFQHIFFTGALSVNWPSVLVAWWSNFAWAGGMIYSQSMQNSINHLIGNDIGNTSQVGAAPSDSTQSVGGGYDISQIYARTLGSGPNRPSNHPLMRDIASDIYGGDYGSLMRRNVLRQHFERSLHARDVLANKSDGYKWYGHAVPSGLPLPGNYSGFAGTLAEQGIRVSNAFMTGFLWFLILLVLLVAAVVALKWTLEGLARVKGIKHDRLKFFRDHWLRYTAAVALRTCYIAFFMMMFLTIFQFTYLSSGGVKGVAGVVFAIFLVGIPGAAAYACYYKAKVAGKESHSRSHQVERKKLLGAIPWIGKKKTGSSESDDQAVEDTKRGAPFFQRMASAGSLTNSRTEIDNIHDHDDYTMKFGWLASRFRRTRWWFFTVWILYEFVRAAFYGGASGYALAQVFGLLIVEFLAFAFVIWARPFEGRRLNLIVVYCLGFSKVASIALSAAFDVRFNLPRIITTVIGIVIIVIQGILTIITMIAIVVGAISSYMSVSRNHEDFRPRKWHGIREKYFNHLDRVVNDVPREKPVPAGPSESVAPKEGFQVRGMKRVGKIEDDDEDFATEMQTQHPNASYASLNDRAQTPVNASDTALPRPKSGSMTPKRASRTPSIQSMSQSNLPYGARPHRPSWAARDFSNVTVDDLDAAPPLPVVDMSRFVPEDPDADAPPPTAASNKRRSKRLSRSNSLPKSINPQMSTDSLHIGGDVSTRDTIGNVPVPTTRPRSGTQGSQRNSRSGTPSHGLGESSDMSESLARSQRNSRVPLTPAQELEEWVPRQSREN